MLTARLACSAPPTTLRGHQDDTFGGYFVLYALLLVYMFGGVAVASDLFMASIESITAVTRTSTREDGSIMEVRGIASGSALVPSCPVPCLRITALDRAPRAAEPARNSAARNPRRLARFTGTPRTPNPTPPHAALCDAVCSAVP